MALPRGILRPISVAPMMEWTDRHFRYMMRQITRHTLLYTEMITAEAILRGDRERLLAFDREELPLALQLGGDNPRALAQAAQIGADFGYTEINLNVGCPSDRVLSGRFGACLMARPHVVSEAVAAMRAAVGLPITVKHRIGISGGGAEPRESYEDLLAFVDQLAHQGCDRFSVHARIAVLGGLSPAENRSVPPLRYEDVYRLKQDRGHLGIELNGGVRDLNAVAAHLRHVDAVMIGRAAYENPYILSQADGSFFGREREAPSREALVEAMIPYIENVVQGGRRKVSTVSRHMISLFAGLPGARAWRRHLSENGPSSDSAAALLRDALKLLPSESRANNQDVINSGLAA